MRSADGQAVLYKLTDSVKCFNKRLNDLNWATSALVPETVTGALVSQTEPQQLSNKQRDDIGFHTRTRSNRWKQTDY